MVVRVNVITPALVETSMSERARANDEIMEYVSRKQPLDGGRIGVPGDLDEAALLLLGEGGRFDEELVGTPLLRPLE